MEMYREKRKETTKLCKRKKQQQTERKMNEIEKDCKNDNTAALYRIQIYEERKKRIINTKEDRRNILENYTQIKKKKRNIDIEENINMEERRYEQVENAIKQLKNNKVLGVIK